MQMICTGTSDLLEFRVRASPRGGNQGGSAPSNLLGAFIRLNVLLMLCSPSTVVELRCQCACWRMSEKFAVCGRLPFADVCRCLHTLPLGCNCIECVGPNVQSFGRHGTNLDLRITWAQGEKYSLFGARPSLFGFLCF